MSTLHRQVSAPRGATTSCTGWPQEAAPRISRNALDPDVAERPAELIVSGGSGRAARSWPAFDVIVSTRRRLEPDETLVEPSDGSDSIADGTREANENLERVLTCGPGLGVVRHADAGDPDAAAAAARTDTDMPMATRGGVLR